MPKLLKMTSALGVKVEVLDPPTVPVFSADTADRELLTKSLEDLYYTSPDLEEKIEDDDEDNE